jgi:hypothetical protein
MTEPLVTYLHDHLAGSRFAIELLQKMEAGYPDHETGHLASALLREIREDRAVLESIIDRVGSARPDFKDATAWLAELASRPKLRHDDPTGLGAFEAFEALGLGIMGKLSLWQSLAILAKTDSRLAGHDFEHLAERARHQHDRIDKYRLGFTQDALVEQTA